ncbi:peptide chain release factor N(5)-glutamine methyltransferase [Naumannella huperziae]
MTEQVRRLAAALAGGPGESPAAEARILLAHVLGTEPARLITAAPPDAAQRARLDELVARRLTGVPIQHLTGEAYFRRIRLAIGPGAFIPRPETEVLTGWAVERLTTMIARGTQTPVVVELGTGSGAIAAALADEVPGARIHAVELSDDALAWAARNLAGTGVDLRHGDLADAFGDLDGGVDLVIANPPYIPLEHWAGVPAEVREHDPDLALFSGPDGLVAMRAVADTARRLLRPGAMVGAEHADVQGESAPAVFVGAGFDDVVDHPDLAGRPRFVTARRPGGGGPRSGRMER